MSTLETCADHCVSAAAKAVAAACLGLLCLMAAPVGLRAESPPAAACAVPSALLDSQFGLPHLAERLRRGEPIKIVALGSSSTEGVGASTPQASYPSRLEVELRGLWPNVPVTVVNKGVSGEQARQMLARFQHDVLDEKPDLLIWQTGTNSALAHGEIDALVEDIDRGIDLAHSAGIDVLLMTPQHSPKFDRVRNKQAYLDNIAIIAAVNRVPVLRRYEVMRHWLESRQMTGHEMIDPDGLHLTDRSYFCLGLTTARMLSALAGAANSRLPVAAAGR
jgi:lysophospholipase L1-like esterase